MTMSLKQWLKDHLPAPAVRGIQRVHVGLNYIRDKELRREAHDRKVRRQSFERLNQTSPPGKLRIRPGIEFAVATESVDSFAPFGWSDERMFEELDFFLKLAHGASSFLDVGAFHGVYSLTFCRATGGAAYMFEPSPMAFPTLRQQAELNPDLKLTAQQIAIGDSVGEITMTYEWKHLVVNPMVYDSPPQNPAKSERVPLTTLDRFCAKQHLTPDLVKIDVEGFEYSVFKGARQMLADAKPSLIVEIHFGHLHQQGISANSIGGLLKEIGYRLFTLTGEELDADHIATPPTQLMDVIAIHTGRADVLARVFPTLGRNGAA